MEQVANLLPRPSYTVNKASEQLVRKVTFGSAQREATGVGARPDLAGHLFTLTVGWDISADCP